MDVPYVNIRGDLSLIKDELLDAASRVMDHGQLILGPEVQDFEERFAGLCNVSHSVGVNSGTDAIVLALRCLGIGAGDEVITVPNSFVATASAIAMLGAIPVFCDVCDDFNIDVEKIEDLITPRTKAILPVHLTGRPADMPKINQIAKKHQLWVIEDAAQAVMARFNDQPVGSFGDAGCFSLHPLKTLSACGDAGIVTVNDAKLYEQIKILRNIGLQTRNDAAVWGGNSRLDTMQAAFLLVKLKYLQEWTEKRRANASYYNENLADVAEVVCPIEKDCEYAVYHTYVIQADRRDSLQKFLMDSGIHTAVHYPVPIHLQSVCASLDYKKGSFPVAEKQCDRILSLPVYPLMDKDSLDKVIEGIRLFYRT